MLKRKFLIGGLIIILAIAYLGYTGFKSSATYYYTVDEAIQKDSSIYGEKIRVSGKVVTGSIQADKLSLKFAMTAGGKNLPVAYQGVTPDSFRGDSDIVVEGRLEPSGVFQATSILTKCPSKYEPLQ